MATPPDWSVGLAVSLDGEDFTLDAYNPVFDRTTDFINHPSELDPALLRLPDRWLLYYRRARPGRQRRRNVGGRRFADRDALTIVLAVSGSNVG
jgi:hypothetical protein